MRVLNNSAAVSKDIDADKRKEKRVVEHPWQKTLSAVQRAVHNKREKKQKERKEKEAKQSRGKRMRKKKREAKETRALDSPGKIARCSPAKSTTRKTSLESETRALPFYFVWVRFF
jgi:hypothetical protein